MSFPVDLEGLWSARRRSSRRPGRDQRKRCSGWIEPLESRRLLATLDIAGATFTPGPLTFTSGSSSSGLITVSISGSNYTFTDSTEPITLNFNASTLGWTNNGPNSVTGPVSSATSILINPVDTGSTFDLQDLQTPTTFQPQNGGAIPVTVGGDPTLGLRGIAANITMANPLGSIALTVDDSASTSTSPQTVTLGATSMSFLGATGTQTINYANVTALTVNGSVNPNPVVTNLYTVNLTPNNSTVTLNAGRDKTDVTVNATGAPSTLNIQGQGAVETVTISTVGDGAAGVVNIANTGPFTALTSTIDPTLGSVGPIISASQITHLIQGTINYAAGSLSSLSIVSGNTGNNHFTVTGTPAGATTTLTSALFFPGHTDFYDVEATTGTLAIAIDNAIADIELGTTSGTLANINGNVDFSLSSGGTNEINLSLNDSKDPTPRTATIGASATTGLSPAAINYGPSGGIPTLNTFSIVGGTANNSFTFTGTPTITDLTLNTGSNTVSVQATSHFLGISAPSLPSLTTIDTITVGNAGSTQGINGIVEIGGNPRETQAVVDDSADPTGRNATFSSSAGLATLAGLSPQPIQFGDSFSNGLALLTIHSGTGANTLNVDFSNENPLQQISSLVYNGGSGSNTLNLQGGTFTNESYSASGPGAGSINLDGSAINFTGLKPINDTTPVLDFTFNAPPTSLSIATVNIVDGPMVNGFQTTQINGVSQTGATNFELVNFANKTNVTVNALGGTSAVPQIVTVNNLIPAPRLTTLAVNTGAGSDLVTLTATPPNVALSVNTGFGGPDTVDVTAAGLGAGSTVRLDGGGGALIDTLNVDAGGQTVRVTATTVNVGTHPTINLTNFTEVFITNAADQPITGNLPELITSPNGVLNNTVVGSFVDDDPAGQTSNFTADINWGDGTPDTSGTITQPGGPGTTFDIVASHTFVGGGVFPVVISVMDHGNTGKQILGGIPFFISDSGGSSTVAGSVVEAPIIATAGVEFTRTVASFIPPSGIQIPPQLVTATINWGDHTTPSVVQGMAGTFPNSIVIVASHTYALPGIYTINVVASALGFSVPFQLEAIVSAPNTDILHGTGQTIFPTVNVPFSGSVATFTDTNTSTPATAFVSEIDWGDGFSTQGSVSGSGGSFTISGTHTYLKTGTFSTATVVFIPLHNNAITIAGSAVVSNAQQGLVVTNVSDDDIPGSLRHVIGLANSRKGGTIRFDIPGPAPYLINVGSSPGSFAGAALPDVTAANVIIDARTQPGYAGTPLVVINGTHAGLDANGLTFDGGNDAVYGLVINGFGDVGVALQVAGGDIVQGNYIGTDGTGTVKAPNFQGVVIFGTSNNLIGGTTPGAGNLISGNKSAGIQILNNATVFDTVNPPPKPLTNTPAQNNAIQNNQIGTTADGSAPLPNQQGVFINDAAFNLVGGTTPFNRFGSGAGNLIAGNTSIGLQILGDHATGNAVLGNTFANNGRGIFVYAVAGNNVVQPGVNMTGSPRPLSDGPNVEAAVPFPNQQGQVQGVIVVFTMYMNRALVENPGEYTVALLGRPNTFDPIASAVYNNPNRTVMLTFQNPLPTSQLFQLRINGTAPSGLTDRVGPPDWLDGNLLLPRVPTGSPFVATFQGLTAVANPDITNQPPATGAKAAAAAAQKAARQAQKAKQVHAAKPAHPVKPVHPAKVVVHQAKPTLSSKAVDALLARKGGIRVRKSAAKRR
jgi:hypothetical protein